MLSRSLAYRAFPWPWRVADESPEKQSAVFVADGVGRTTRLWNLPDRLEKVPVFVCESRERSCGPVLSVVVPQGVLTYVDGVVGRAVVERPVVLDGIPVDIDAPAADVARCADEGQGGQRFEGIPNWVPVFAQHPLAGPGKPTHLLAAITGVEFGERTEVLSFGLSGAATAIGTATKTHPAATAVAASSATTRCASAPVSTRCAHLLPTGRRAEPDSARWGTPGRARQAVRVGENQPLTFWDVAVGNPGAGRLAMG